MFKLNLLKLNLIVHLRHLMDTCAAQRKFGDLIKICIVYMTSHGYPLDKLCHSGSTFAFCDLPGFILPMWHIWEKWCTCSWVLRCSNFISGLKETVFPADTWTVLHYFSPRRVQIWTSVLIGRRWKNLPAHLGTSPLRCVSRHFFFRLSLNEWMVIRQNLIFKK